MEKQLSVYFDYTCPYCYQGVSDLIALLPGYPQLTVTWVPCEAHPIPEPAWVHSSLASQMMLAVAAYGGDLIQFHMELFELCFVKRQRIDDTEQLIHTAVLCGADREKVAAAMQNRQFEHKVEENNILVWESMRLEAVPCYQSGKNILTSYEDVMLPKKKLKAFLDAIGK